MEIRVGDIHLFILYLWLPVNCEIFEQMHWQYNCVVLLMVIIDSNCVLMQIQIPILHSPTPSMQPLVCHNRLYVLKCVVCSCIKHRLQREHLELLVFLQFKRLL